MYKLFPALRSAATSEPERSPVASSRCWRMARALIQRPKVLLVDELSMGLAPAIVERLFEAVRQAATNRGCAVIFVEQYVHVALQVADTASVINRGSIVLSGPAADLGAKVEVVEEAYLGATEDRPMPVWCRLPSRPTGSTPPRPDGRSPTAGPAGPYERQTTPARRHHPQPPRMAAERFEHAPVRGHA